MYIISPEMARVNRFKQYRACIAKNLLSTLRIWKLEVFSSQLKNVGIPKEKAQT